MVHSCVIHIMLVHTFCMLMYTRHIHVYIHVVRLSLPEINVYVVMSCDRPNYNITACVRHTYAHALSIIVKF